jgi:two-component system, NtrC family, sensor kinase
LIELYQDKYPQSDPEIEGKIDEIDLDYIRDDLPKLIASMKLGVERIGHISTSLRTFSRTDKDEQVPFNLHEGIDSTLLILKHRLKANEKRPQIEVITHYDNLPKINCFAGQLNQVFMNLLSNAIDAIEESNLERSFAEIQACSNRITIGTRVEGEQVKITISDNGKGMPKDVMTRIFEQGFTTKKVGKGTGLGLAIACQIVESLHGGMITVHSEFGKGTDFIITLPVKKKFFK